MSYLYLFKGTSIYYAESLETIGDNLKEVTPDLFTTVPRLLEKVYDRIMQKGSELTGIKRKLFLGAWPCREIRDQQGYGRLVQYATGACQQTHLFQMERGAGE